MFNKRAAMQTGIVAVALVAIDGTLTSLQAQNDPARQGGALPTADQILAKYEQALGGAAALGKINTRITRTRRFQDVGSPEDHELVRYTKRPADPNGRLLSTTLSTATSATAPRLRSSSSIRVPTRAASHAYGACITAWKTTCRSTTRSS